MIKASIIVPCHNSEQFIIETIESVIDQDLEDWELILVDDGSVDTSWEIIKRYSNLDNRIIALKKQNEGTTKTRNFGFKKTDPHSSYIMFLDHDDKLEKNTLSKLISYLDENPRVGLVTCQFKDINLAGKLLGKGRRSRWVPGRFIPRKMRDNEYETPFVTFYCGTGQGPFALYKRAIYSKTTGWSISFWPHEDSDIFCQMALLAPVHCLPWTLYNKRIHPKQGLSDGEKVQHAYKKFREKWDNYNCRNEHERKIVEEAKLYYITRHLPFRNFKTFILAIIHIFKMKDFASIRWALVIFRETCKSSYHAITTTIKSSSFF